MSVVAAIEDEVARGEITILTGLDESRWDQFVRSRPESSGYHLWRWRRVFERAFGHDTVYLAALQGDDVVGVLPLVVFDGWLFGRFAVSLPFVNYGGVLAADDRVARALVEHAAAISDERRLAHVELRHTTRRFDDLPVKQHKVGMILKLAADPDAAWNAIDRKARNQVRKAEKSGLSATIGGAELLGDFYRVFARNMRDLGTPVYSRQFFEEVLSQCADCTRVIAVFSGQTAVAAAITHEHRDIVEVPWASSLQSFRTLSPNNLLYWTIMRDAVLRNRRLLDFGRSTPNEGTFKFKAQWGAEPQPLHWEYRLVKGDAVPDQSPKNPKFQKAIAVWKHLPVSLTKILGPRIVRSIP
jgi:FemAB-related protein (PEP-CTERM system-associated)